MNLVKGTGGINFKISLIPCSAKMGDGLIEGIDWIVSDISSRIFI